MSATSVTENNYHDYPKRCMQILNSGGMKMNAQDFWQVFLETGAPEMYLLYNKARKAEMTHVSNGAGIGPESNIL